MEKLTAEEMLTARLLESEDRNLALSRELLRIKVEAYRKQLRDKYGDAEINTATGVITPKPPVPTEETP